MTTSASVQRLQETEHVHHQWRLYHDIVNKLDIVLRERANLENTKTTEHKNYRTAGVFVLEKNAMPDTDHCWFPLCRSYSI